MLWKKISGAKAFLRLFLTCFVLQMCSYNFVLFINLAWRVWLLLTVFLLGLLIMLFIVVFNANSSFSHHALDKCITILTLSNSSSCITSNDIILNFCGYFWLVWLLLIA